MPFFEMWKTKGNVYTFLYKMTTQKGMNSVKAKLMPFAVPNVKFVTLFDYTLMQMRFEQIMTWFFSLKSILWFYTNYIYDLWWGLFHLQKVVAWTFFKTFPFV